MFLPLLVLVATATAAPDLPDAFPVLLIYVPIGISGIAFWVTVACALALLLDSWKKAVAVVPYLCFYLFFLLVVAIAASSGVLG